MSPAAEIISALAAHKARVAVEGHRVRVLFRPGHPPPAELIQAARQHGTRVACYQETVRARFGERSGNIRSERDPIWRSE
jgi:hypothetical protein